ncbi:alpha/beta fold hydrolase [Streptomyces sp. NPDC001663]|uniref:alpha/beta fold hydrolase n=1 Tax=Streptomyces sp. NPDC001663 TaxID=3364597 RepID=UPI003695A64A
MADVLVLGAGLNGLATAMLLARDGHRVSVLERDGAEPCGGADELWETWQRPGLNQFRLLHLMLPRWRVEIGRELPDVLAELEELGGFRVNTVGMLPIALTGGAREDDDRFETVTARRPVLEAALSVVAARTAGVSIHRGVTVRGLLTGTQSAPGVPHITGVMADGGQTFRADLVVDTTGRRSPVMSMLDAVGGRRPDEEREDSGFVYYTRHYRSRSGDGGRPKARAMVLQHFDSVSALTLPCDSGTWGVGLIASSQDRRLRALREPGTWDRALALFPTVAHWGDGEPITGVQVIAGIEDRHRRFVIGDRPVATGLLTVGDAWACTNPSLGRGSSIGALHACALRDLLRESDTGKHEELVLRFHEMTEARVGPYLRATLAYDRHRLAEINGDITGHPYRTADPAWAINKAMEAAALRDPDVLRARASIAALLEMPQEALSRPGVMDKVLALGSNAPQYATPGPARAELLAAIGENDGPARAAAPAGSRSPATATDTERTGHVERIETADHNGRPVGTRIDVNGIGINVQVTGQGPAVLLLHGWPDTHALWRHQVAALTAAGYRTIAPDLRGFGDSDKPADIGDYGIIQIIGDLIGVLDHLGVHRVHVIGHDWGGAIGAVFAALSPARAASLTCLSVGHPGAFRSAGLAQREKSWYMLLFQFPDVAEQWLSRNDFENFRAWARHPDTDAVIARLSAPGALTATLGVYRAVLPPESLITPPAQLPPVQAPTMGLWSDGDIAVTERALTGTASYVSGPWRYERIDGAGHWMQLDAPDHVNNLLLDFLGKVSADGSQAAVANERGE